MFKKFIGLCTTASLASVIAFGCSSSSNNNPTGDDGGTDAKSDVVHKDGSPVDSSRGDDSATDDGGGGGFDGTTGKQCTGDADCKGANGPGINRCTAKVFQSGPLYPTPVCILTQCDPGSDNNLHFCDGPDDPSSPGICLSTGQPGKGICLPQCTFKGDDGVAPKGCVGKDVCNVVGWGTDQNMKVVGFGYCFGGCTADGDCPSGSKCQVDEGLCVTAPKTRTKNVGDACTNTDGTNGTCNCLYNTQTNKGFCTSACEVGGAACANGWVCETQLPLNITGANDASTTGFTKQPQGLSGSCAAPCSGDGGTCPTNTMCQSQTLAGPDCFL